MIRTHFSKIVVALFSIAGAAQAQPTPDSTWNKFAGTPTTWSTAVNWLTAAAQAILMSVLATCRQAGRDALDFFGSAFRAPTAPALIKAA